MYKYMNVEEISNYFNLAVVQVKNYISRGEISMNDLQFRPLRVYMTKENAEKFNTLRDNLYKNDRLYCRKKENKIYIHGWNYTAFKCYTSHYDCANCIVSKLETIEHCNMPAVVAELLNKEGEPKPDLYN